MLKNILNKKISQRLKNAFFIINKEKGRTSHDEVHFLRKTLSNLLGHKIKVGHSGTLDPKVTGILVIGSGRAVRGLEYILLSKKTYIAEFLFHKELDRTILLKNLEKFKGKITQMPPLKSSVKREERIREIYQLNLLEFDNNGRWAKLLCEVERGTYIRKLAHDLGQEMNINTSMGDLVRIKAGVFSQKNSNIISQKDFSKLLEEFYKEKNIFKKYKKYKKLKLFIYSISEIFNRLEEEKTMKKIFIKKRAKKYILSGAKPRIKNICKNTKNIKGEVVSIFYKKQVLAVGEFIEDFPKENLQEKETGKKKEGEIIKLKKVFNY